ncbi:type IVB secretion system protein IcmJDotN [Ferrimonas marina]|uniref:Intracellular multiplication protein IcmJ n=1 Tax=Ferrimonas marina TaxID=299255 RepID=A0A1M5TII9_9GAMM|nr:type IVB secretion system protein IcmJDotN [Ferrimonas marina]SHH50480.1 intracellular multiplication protein IcmJ [Ferrimonas marina]
MRPITLSVKRSAFRVDDKDAHLADAQFGKVAASVRRRDANTCQFCGFQSSKWHEVHHIDDDHSNNNESNLVLACPLCHLAHHVGFAGVAKKAILIVLPEMEGFGQADLNQLVRYLWIASEQECGEVSVTAKSLLNQLYDQRDPVMELMGSADPGVLADFLMEMSEEEYRDRAKVLRGLFLLPEKSGFERQLQHWIEESKRSMPINRWEQHAGSKLQSWAKANGGKGTNSEIYGLLKGAR